MVIDAMDLLYSGRFDGFCLVSSDSDFTRLASRLRESGLTVYGFGERKTPKAFVAACDKFIYIENLRKASADHAAEAAGAAPAAVPKSSAAQLKRDTALMRQLRAAVEAASDEDGWAALGYVGTLITKQQPDFDSRSYGYSKLMDLMTATTVFDLERRSTSDGRPGVIYIREKRARSAASKAASSSAAATGTSGSAAAEGTSGSAAARGKSGSAAKTPAKTADRNT
jgi:uncharacterized LabA/DUF88 family protein